MNLSELPLPKVTGISSSGEKKFKNPNKQTPLIVLPFDKSFSQLGAPFSNQRKTLFLLHLLEFSFCLLSFILIIFLLISVLHIKCFFSCHLGYEAALFQQMKFMAPNTLIFTLFPHLKTQDHGFQRTNSEERESIRGSRKNSVFSVSF